MNLPQTTGTVLYNETWASVGALAGGFTGTYLLTRALFNLIKPTSGYAFIVPDLVYFSVLAPFVGLGAYGAATSEHPVTNGLAVGASLGLVGGAIVPVYEVSSKLVKEYQQAQQSKRKKKKKSKRKKKKKSQKR